MSTLRSILVPLSAVWLSLHILVMTGPALLAFTSGSSDIICTCAHGADHGTCPMHRTRTDSTRCQLQGTQDDFATVVVSLNGPLMFPTISTVVFLEAATADSTRYSSLLQADWIVPPEPPPPRS